MSPRVAYWTACVVFTTLVLAKFSPHTGFTSLIRFGEQWQDHRHSSLRDLPIATCQNSNGYDGQFYAQLALDPLLRSPELEKIIDTPAYRARRILIPVTAAIFGFGNPWWTLQVYALLNVICWFALGLVLHRQLDPGDRRALARWFGCMFSMGVLESVRQSLVDLPALLLIALAANAYTPAGSRRSTPWLVLACLAKETSFLGALALHIDMSLRPFPWRRAGVSLLITVLPLALWALFVHHHFANAPGSEGFGNISWPFFGGFTQAKFWLREVALGNLNGRYSFGLIALIGLLTQSWVLWRQPQPGSPWWRIGMAYSLLLLFLSSWVWSGYWAVCRAVLPLTIAFNLLLPAGRWFWPLWIVGNLTLLHGVWRSL